MTLRLLMLVPFASLYDPCTVPPLPPGDDDDAAESCGDQECDPGACCVVACDDKNGRQDRCAVPPDACADTWEPVCGCDDVTYGNACQAEAACVGVAHRGLCAADDHCGDQVCGCCLRGCGGPDEGEQCINPGNVCPAVYAPVCGCDGTTYGNDCWARSRCTAVAHDGPCAETTCEGWTCAEGACCLRSCGGTVDPIDQCLDRPEVCPDVSDPVCGCDGVTYDSPCTAHAACVAVSFRGACDTGP